jgi:methyltransferase (TIGR00027 family)
VTEAVIQDISDTARWLAHYRALESERERPLFRDPLARRLAGERGRALAERTPKEPLASSIAVGTRVFDDLILQALRDHAVHTVVNLAAGLDTRPYRLDVPASLRWIEVDKPALIQAKNALLVNERAHCELERVGLDLKDQSSRGELFARINRESSRVLVVSEGFLVYLTEREVGALAEDLHGSFPSALWLLEMFSPAVLQQVQESVGKELDAANAGLKFAPNEGLAFFAKHGFVPLHQRSLVEEAARLGREMRALTVLRWAARIAPELVRKLLEERKQSRDAVVYALMQQRRQ